MEIQERKKYIDILKGIGIFYVILGHVTHTSFLFRYIYSFHMPLFFFISGMLFVPFKMAREKYFDIVKKSLSFAFKEESEQSADSLYLFLSRESSVLVFCRISDIWERW